MPSTCNLPGRQSHWNKLSPQPRLGEEMTLRALAILGWSHNIAEVESPIPQEGLAYSMMEARKDQLLYSETALLPQAASPHLLDLLPCQDNTINHGKNRVFSPCIRPPFIPFRKQKAPLSAGSAHDCQARDYISQSPLQLGTST